MSDSTPSHYDGDYQPFDLIDRLKLDFKSGDVIKRLKRLHLKGQLDSDLAKIDHVLGLLEDEQGSEVESFISANKLGFFQSELVRRVCARDFTGARRLFSEYRRILEDGVRR